MVFRNMLLVKILKNAWKYTFTGKVSSKRPFYDYFFGCPYFNKDDYGHSYKEHGIAKFMFWSCYIFGGFLFVPLVNILRIFTEFPCNFVTFLCKQSVSYMDKKRANVERKSLKNFLSVGILGVRLVLAVSEISRKIVQFGLRAIAFAACIPGFAVFVVCAIPFGVCTYRASNVDAFCSESQTYLISRLKEEKAKQPSVVLKEQPKEQPIDRKVVNVGRIKGFLLWNLVPRKTCEKMLAKRSSGESPRIS